MFLEALRDQHDVRKAARAADISHQQVYLWRERDKRFAEGWAFAMRVYVDDLKASAFKRARDGTNKPIMYRDKVVAVAKEFETGLTIFLLKKLEADVFGDKANQIQGMSPEEYATRSREAVAAMEASTVERVPVFDSSTTASDFATSPEKAKQEQATA